MKKLLMCLVVVVVAMQIILSGNDTKDVKVLYTIKTGETPWQVAEKLMTRYGDTRDIREVLYYAEGGKGLVFPGDKIIFNLKSTNGGEGAND